MRHARLALFAVVMLTVQPALADCPEDLNGDDYIDLADLGILLASYDVDAGGDIDGDGDTDLADLGALLAVFGTDCGGDPEPPAGMVLIPAGEFAMGDHHGSGYGNELPLHDVSIDALFMDVLETSNQRYAAYLNDAYPSEIKVVSGVVYGVADSGNNYPYCDTYPNSRIHWDGSTFTVTAGEEDHPMTDVSWYGAAACANWRSTEEGRQPAYDLGTWTCDFGADGYRLPTEAEWEYAARGHEHTPYYIYPWGNEINGSHANCICSGDPWEGVHWPETTPVGYYDGGQTPPGVDMANGYGLYDMAGNVWEWCNDWYDDDYYSVSPYDNPKGPSSGMERVLRGGSWNDYAEDLRCAIRGRNFPDYRYEIYGFRLVLDAE
jgi:formylglycine-generating enzyme required for sulfatase activity